LTLPTFKALGLSESLLRALDDADYDTPTAIQVKAIPPLLEGRDLLGLAQTGTGKTAAFVLPMLQALSGNRRHPIPRSARALILAPTRELAIQISDSVRTYGKHTGLRHAVIMGGVSQRMQVKAMSRGIDLLIATPGRLLDLVEQRQVDLGRAMHLVLDEADRMLDMGFIRDVRRLIALLPRNCQSMLFSATMPKEVSRLSAEILNDPVRVEIAAKSIAVDRIEQLVHHAERAEKRKLLTELLADRNLSRVIVFTRTKHGADNVSKQLAAAGVGAAAIHGDKSQGQREKALDSFRKGRTRVLVATDIVARGIDVDDVSHVINYELPNDPESYVHRIGRTARAGASGIAISFCDSSEQDQLRGIENLIKSQLTVVGDGPTRRSRISQGDRAADLRNQSIRPTGEKSAARAKPNRRGRRRKQRQAA
jgi:ATP-dependent RNA helicase RhlE